MPILSPDEISTIFVVGFPPDMKEREFQNIFMFASGFEGASLKIPEQCSLEVPCATDRSGEESSSGSFDASMQLGGLTGVQGKGSAAFRQQIIGFARFQRRQDALAARDHLNGRCIDPERSCVLKVEMAKKNLFIAPRKASIHVCSAGRDEFNLANEASDDPIIPLMRTTRSLSLSIPGNPAPIDISHPGALFPKGPEKSPVESLKQPSFISNAGRSFSLANGTANPMYILGENPPCNTLYVGNLPLNADVNELQQLFQPCDGFRRLSYKTKPNGPMCFVEFEDIPCARKAMDSLYGTLLSSSTKGGIRLSYSKNPLGVRSSTPNSINHLSSQQRPIDSETASMDGHHHHNGSYFFDGAAPDIAAFIGGQTFKVA